MDKYVLFLVYLNIRFIFMYRHAKPVAESIWKKPCTKHSSILNDCNWCRCSSKSQYSCDARVCSEVDMFGHFNDAIRDIDVGMEGHGAWRTGQTACEPGVHYERDEVLCICTEDGDWPSTVCRDIFRVLHPVKKINNLSSFIGKQCVPAKLYLIGCNVCFCPADGVPRAQFCTKKKCLNNDPVFDIPKEKNKVSEIYAVCNVNIKYKLGCQTCDCLRNNRLVCDNCTTIVKKTLCSNRRPGERFDVDCNSCQCDKNGMIYCSVKRCHKNDVRSKDTIIDADFTSIEKPIDDINCVLGTQYKKDCNVCYCFMSSGIKKFGCTVKKCSDRQNNEDCVIGTVYEMNCLICQCDIYNGEKMQICHEDPKCRRPEDQELIELSDLRGYCEPLHLYKNDCNTCECLTDGKSVKCTSNHCQNDRIPSESDDSSSEPVQSASNSKPISVEVITVMKDVGECSIGNTFKIDCNLCFCLSNGDVVCTTTNCGKNELTNEK